jgi:hypothetical protein
MPELRLRDLDRRTIDKFKHSAERHSRSLRGMSNPFWKSKCERTGRSSSSLRMRFVKTCSRAAGRSRRVPISFERTVTIDPARQFIAVPDGDMRLGVRTYFSAGLAIYDATYVALADILGCTVITADDRLEEVISNCAE